MIFTCLGDIAALHCIPNISLWSQIKMARRLPWLKESKNPSTRITKCPKAELPQSDDDHAEASDHATSSLHKAQAINEASRSTRNPSSSPPPSPPRQDYMHPGLQQDDIWVMVEDEFLSTAHFYTSHLHKAEYLRLKKLARAENASAIRDIARPVDDRTEQSMEGRKKMQGARQRIKGEKAMRNLHGGRGKDEDENLWIMDPRLAGLMTQRENTGQLSKITGIRSKTRASAGFMQASQSQAVVQEVDEDMDESEGPPWTTLPKPQAKRTTVLEKEREEDSDDLEGSSQSFSQSLSKLAHTAEPRRTPSIPTYTFNTCKLSTEQRVDAFHSHRSKSPTEETRPKPTVIGTSKHSLSATKPQAKSTDISMDLDDFVGYPNRQVLRSRSVGRFGRRKDDRKVIEKKKQSEEVPTFLF